MFPTKWFSLSLPSPGWIKKSTWCTADLERVCLQHAWIENENYSKPHAILFFCIFCAVHLEPPPAPLSAVQAPASSVPIQSPPPPVYRGGASPTTVPDFLTDFTDSVPEYAHPTTDSAGVQGVAPQGDESRIVSTQRLALLYQLYWSTVDDCFFAFLQAAWEQGSLIESRIGFAPSVVGFHMNQASSERRSLCPAPSFPHLLPTLPSFWAVTFFFCWQVRDLETSICYVAT